MSRNKDETRQHILHAALASLADEGFAAFGINSVARRAGYDKKLIYRYFDGLDGLITAMGEAVAAELSAALAPHLDPAPETYAALIDRLARALFGHLWRNARYRQLRVMEAAAPTVATHAFRAARGKAMQSWMIAARGALIAPKDVDVAATNAALIAMIEGITLLGPSGMAPDDPATRIRLEAVLTQAVQALYP